MTSNEYQDATRRTELTPIAYASKFHTCISLNNRLAGVIHCAMKLSSESGELNDALVKHVVYGQPLDSINIGEECGDLLWYIARILDHCGYTMEECMLANIEKLKIRYPEKFTEFHAKERLDKKQ